MPDINELFQKELDALVRRDEAMVLIERSIAALGNVYAAEEVRTWLIEATRILFPDPEQDALTAAFHKDLDTLLAADPGPIRDAQYFYDDVNDLFLGPEYQRAARRMAAELAEKKFLPARPSSASLSRWRAILKEEMGTAVEVQLFSDREETVASRLRRRGIPIPAEGTKYLKQQAEIATRRILTETDDLLNTLQRGVRLGQSAPGYSLDRLLGDDHTALVGRSIGQRAADEYESRIVAKGVKEGKLTGKVRWHSSGRPDSRHRDLAGAQADHGKDFNVNGYRAKGPRDPRLPVNQSSLCKCFLEYETVDKKEWI